MNARAQPTEFRSYLPDIWDNDAEMRGLMSMPKARRINPTNYDRVINFWTKIIGDYCLYQKKCIFTLDELKENHQRGNQLPSPMGIAIEEMQKSGVVQLKREFDKKNQGWLEWGTSLMNPVAWLGLGISAPDQSEPVFVHLPTLQVLAIKLLQFYRDEFQMVDCPDVVDYLELRERSSAEAVIHPDCYELVIGELVRMGEVSIGLSHESDKVLKFKDQLSKSPAKFTDTDASVHELRKAMNRIENDIRRAEDREIKLKEEAVTALRRGDKKGALNTMRRKKRVEKEISDKDVQYRRLVNMLEQLAQSKQTKEIIEMYKAGSRAFKETLARQGLTPEDVETTMVNVHEAMQDFQDVSSALREGFETMPGAYADSIDETELEEELNAILAEEDMQPSAPEESIVAAETDVNKVRVGKRVLDIGDLPDVPSRIPGGPISGGSHSVSDKELEERWKRLRSTAQ